jgi:y4mF family transcriptional regulator
MDIGDAKALGALIRQRRKDMGLTQLDAAGLCGVGERFLSELERGKASASLGKTLQVLKRLGLKIQVQASCA